jgi:hypothetical protein
MSIQKSRRTNATDSVKGCPAPERAIDFTARSWGTGITVKPQWNSLVLSGTPCVRPDSYGGFISVDFASNDPRADTAFVYLPVSFEQPTLESVAEKVAGEVNLRTPYTAQVHQGAKGSFTILFGRKPEAGGDVKGAGSSAQKGDGFSEL